MVCLRCVDTLPPLVVWVEVGLLVFKLGVDWGWARVFFGKL